MPFSRDSYRTAASTPVFNSPGAHILSVGFLMGVVLLWQGPAYSGWEVILENKEAGMTVYVDSDAMRREGDSVRMWQLFDFKTIKTVADHSLLSSKILTQYDCREVRSRRLTYLGYSGKMAGGQLVLSDSNHGEWMPVTPRSMGRTLWTRACGHP